MSDLVNHGNGTTASEEEQVTAVRPSSNFVSDQNPLLDAQSFAEYSWPIEHGRANSQFAEHENQVSKGSGGFSTKPFKKV